MIFKVSSPETLVRYDYVYYEVSSLFEDTPSLYEVFPYLEVKPLEISDFEIPL